MFIVDAKMFELKILVETFTGLFWQFFNIKVEIFKLSLS